MKTVTTLLTEQELEKFDNFIKENYKNIKISRSQFVKKLILDVIQEDW